MLIPNPAVCFERRHPKAPNLIINAILERLESLGEGHSDSGIQRSNFFQHQKDLTRIFQRRLSRTCFLLKICGGIPPQQKLCTHKSSLTEFLHQKKSSAPNYASRWSIQRLKRFKISNSSNQIQYRQSEIIGPKTAVWCQHSKPHYILNCLTASVQYQLLQKFCS